MFPRIQGLDTNPRFPGSRCLSASTKQAAALLPSFAKLVYASYVSPIATAAPFSKKHCNPDLLFQMFITQ
ncbi:jg4132 [Pararge aegeria aegeria]|uniref:Jg4132 protein n=1 Tax=Pararge aegeria aegeria TaxID=348720 RepID=A0A8S4QRE7_9NEOP|nr:jg4132 [Pararge aegeria aegeria]